MDFELTFAVNKGTVKCSYYVKHESYHVMNLEPDTLILSFVHRTQHCIRLHQTLWCKP